MKQRQVRDVLARPQLSLGWVANVLVHQVPLRAEPQGIPEVEIVLMIPGKSNPKKHHILSPKHLAWIRKFNCAVVGCFQHPVQAAHVRSGGDGATGMKPGDDWAIPLCHHHHREQHNIGEPEFERRYDMSLTQLARVFAGSSPHLKVKGKHHEEDRFVPGEEPEEYKERQD